MNLTLIGEDSFCKYCETLNETELTKYLVLKQYVNGDGNALRVLNAFSKNLTWREIKNNIESNHQRGIAAFSCIPREDWPSYIGKILLVRRVDKLPFDCILSGEDAVFYNKDDGFIKFNQAVGSLREWLLKNNQYQIENPAAFLLSTRKKALCASEIITNFFESRKLRLLSFKMSLGIEFDDYQQEIIPIWRGEGVIPQTAKILENGQLIKDPKYLARIILPPSVFKKQIGEN
jgi:hypothetical protein